MGLLERDHLGEENLLDWLDSLERRLASVERSAATGSSLSGDHGDLTGLGDDDHTQYLLADGSRGLTDSLSVVAGKTIDGVDLSAHAHTGADGSVKVAHTMLDTTYHSYVGGANLDVFGLSAPNTLARLTPSSNPGAAASLLCTSAGGLVRLAGIGIGVAAFANHVCVAGDVSAAGGLYAGSAVGLPGAGEILGTGDIRIDGGIYVGDKGGAVTTSDLRAAGDICAGGGGYFGSVSGEPTNGWVYISANSGTTVPTLRINSTDTVVAGDQVLGAIEFYSNDSSGHGTGVAAYIKAVDANEGYGTSTHLEFGTAAENDTGAGTVFYITDEQGTGNLAYFNGIVSANSFTDRSPVFTGDALSAIRSIRGRGTPAMRDKKLLGDGWQEVDHSTLPEGILFEKSNKGVVGRDLGAQAQFNTRAIQQLLDRVEYLESELERKVA